MQIGWRYHASAFECIARASQTIQRLQWPIEHTVFCLNKMVLMKHIAAANGGTGATIPRSSYSQRDRRAPRVFRFLSTGSDQRNRASVSSRGFGLLPRWPQFTVLFKFEMSVTLYYVHIRVRVVVLTDKTA